jgi:phage terminase Nu1 subunit (DNA packaging protein)
MLQAKTVTVARLARLFGCSERQVQRFVTRDGMPRAKHGLYNFDACIRWRIAILENQLSQKAATPAEERNHDRERTRQISANADLKELKLQERRGELVTITLYQNVMARMIGTARQHLLNLPSRVAHELVGLDHKAIKAKLLEAVERALGAMQTPDRENDAKDAR